MSIPFANDTVTLFNFFEYMGEYGKKERRFIKTFLYNCSLLKTDKKLTIDTISIEADDYSLIVPKNENFREVYEFNGAEGTFTFNTGDIIVKGIVEKDFDASQGTSLIKEEFKNRSFEIKSFNNFTGANIPIEHYQIIGI